METGKPGLASAPAHINPVAAQTERRMDIQAPLTAVYIHTVPALPAQPYPRPPPSAPEPATLHLAMPPLYSKEMLPFLTLHIAGGLPAQPGLSPAAKPKSAGKHVCPHCGRDCMKPSVLEKHLRCHTGERPYPCSTCGISFKTQSNLYKHKRTQAHARLWSESEQSSLGSLDRETGSSSLSLDESVPEGGAEVSAPEMSSADQQEQQRPEKAPRHLPLQRQEATLFSKRWESSASRGKSQSHESTDSGFSESSEHYPSPHSMDSLTESTKEQPEEPPPTPSEQQTLEERISKLISENSAVVEDKQLENVRPRKTVLSKQGSIDLPMPYTYKDSFHFDMKISKAPSVGVQRNRRPGFYSSVPTQHKSTDHAPLIRSNSLPFSVALLQPEGSRALVRRGSSGQISPAGPPARPAAQQPAHRPLVRQTAVDCNHATDAPCMSSSVEEACAGSLSCDGDGEPSNRKFRRKKTQKFAYNKWYMYGGGTFKKLYGDEKGGDEVKVRKGAANAEQEAGQGLQKRLSEGHKEAAAAAPGGGGGGGALVTDGPPAKVSLVSAAEFNLKTGLRSPLQRNTSLSALPLPFTGGEKHADRKKQKTDGKILFPDSNAPTQPAASLSYLKPAPLFSPCGINAANTPSVSASPVTSTAKTSFLPKYQLKLPNAAEPESNLSPHVVDKPAFTSAPAEQAPPSPPSREPVFIPTQSQTLHKQFATTTITTTCRLGAQAGLCSASVQPSGPAGGAAPPAAPPTPAQVLPFDQLQPAAHNVFHVHTADLQICLQIISDEQLALIEPQIERQAGGALEHRCDPDKGGSVEAGLRQKEADQTSPTLNSEGIKPPLSAQCEVSDSTPAPEPQPAEGSAPSRRPRKHGNVNTGRSSEEELGLSLNLADSRGGRGGGVSPSSLNQNSMSGEMQGDRSQRKPTRSGGEAPPPLQVGPPGVAPSYSINMNSQASVSNQNPPECSPPEAPGSSTHAESDADSAPSQEVAVSERDVISAGEQLDGFTSSQVQMGGAKDAPAAGVTEAGGTPRRQETPDCGPAEAAGGAAGGQKSRRLNADEQPGGAWRPEGDDGASGFSQPAPSSAGGLLNSPPLETSSFCWEGAAAAVSCCATLTAGSHRTASSSSSSSQLSHSVLLDNNPAFSFPEALSATGKYQPFFFSGQLHGFPPPDCLSGGVRPVPSCQDYPEDTSSSDDEGKLIIEL